jgi:hypothetical protein
VLGEPDDYLAAALGDGESDGPPKPAVRDGDLDFPRGLEVAPGAARPGDRTMLDCRGQSPLAVLHDAIAAGGEVLAVCADAPRRLTGLRSRIGGFALVSYCALVRDPWLGERVAHVVALDPPTCAADRDALAIGRGFTHLAWGEAELRFAQQMHELEYGLRASLVAFYRSLKLRGRVAGKELEQLLRGDGPHPRPARLAGRLIKVLAELELVSLDRDLPALAIVGAAPTALERSPAYRVYAQRYEDGQRFLSSANHLPGG